MNAPAERTQGFTLIELVTAVAVVAVLAAISVMVYTRYVDRARSVEIMEKFDAIRVSVSAGSAGNTQESCADLAKKFDASNLRTSYANLAYGFEAVTNGYRPVLNVCAQVGQHGTVGVNTAREAYESLAKNGVVEKNPVLLDSVVSFALRLTDKDQSVCKTYATQPTNACASAGGPVSPQIPAQLPTQVPPQAQVSPQVQVPPQPQIPPQAQIPPQSQVPPQGPAKPPGTATSTANSQPPNAQPLDAPQLATDLQSIPAMDFLNQREKETVAATAAQMAISTQYALVVRRVLNGTAYNRAVEIPTTVQAITTIRFHPEMRSALETAYVEGLRRLCVAKNGPNFPRCG